MSDLGVPPAEEVPAAGAPWAAPGAAGPVPEPGTPGSVPPAPVPPGAGENPTVPVWTNPAPGTCRVLSGRLAGAIRRQEALTLHRLRGRSASESTSRPSRLDKPDRTRSGTPWGLSPA